MEKILQFIAEETDGKSYRASKVELDAEIDSTTRIEYEDAAEEIILRGNGETRPTKNPVPLEGQAKNFSANGMQILSYFLDGTRRVYKVDEFAYQTGARKMIYPILAAQVVTGCCRRVEKKLRPEKFSDEIILVLPEVSNYSGSKGFFPALVTKINARFKTKLSAILTYKTNHKPAEKFEDRAVAVIMKHMHDAEINLVAELVRRGKLDQKNYLVKDGSLEYRVWKERDFNPKNYKFVVGVSKKFNPARIKDSADKINPGLVAELPKFHRTPVTICERRDFPDGARIAVWYVRLRDGKFYDSPFDGVVKVEKFLVTDAEVSSGKIDSDEVNLLSAHLINERNPVCYGSDGRWANHIYPIFLTESFIKARSISSETFLNLF
ncbi:MAG: hypothetical protein II902_01095 [Selenomonadaceae bacterium]|nr:hypothetical protein [Selenomonadaceae bacterium]